MEKRNWLSLAVLLVLVSLLIGGCGGGQQTPVDEDQPPSEEQTSEVTVIKLARFFGDCDDSTEGVTDVNQATTECEVIQILTNKFNADNEDVQIERLGGAEWGTYYDALNTSFAGGSPPDVAVMHGSNLPDYTSRGLLKALDEDLAAQGVDVNDWTDPARGGVTYDGSIYAVPFDLHANLWHVNVDLFKEAGLVDDDGNPILPSSREEFMQQAQTMQEETGKLYFATDASQFPVSVRLFLGLVWQQNGSIVSADGKTATVDTPEAREALDFMLEMFNNGYSDANQNYDAAQEAFLTGEAAVLYNGTWVVDQYNRDTSFAYVTRDFPTLYDTPATWANSHMWVIPKQAENAKYEAGVRYITFLNDHVKDWGIGTGHLPPRKSVLASEALQAAPQRENYANTANIAHLVPAIVNWQATEDILKEELESTWLTGEDLDEALSTAQQRVSDQLGQ